MVPVYGHPMESLYIQRNKYITAQGFGAGAARSRGIWLEPEPSLWAGSGSRKKLLGPGAALKQNGSETLGLLSLNPSERNTVPVVDKKNGHP